MVLLIDLDGTLTNTAHQKFKSFKDGIEGFNTNDIPIFPGAIEFVKGLIKEHFVFIISDSHPKYVKKIASEVFGLETDDKNPFCNVVWLADKPNIERTINQLKIYANELDPHCPMIHLPQDKDEFLVIGDSWLDIELGRRLNVRTVLTSFYKASEIEERDGIGQDWKPIKMGPTYYAKSFQELMSIINNPVDYLLSLESIFQGGISSKAVNFKNQKFQSGFTAFRCLARQNDGECDNYARADMYYQIDNPNRSQDFLLKLSNGVEAYLNEVLKFKDYSWDYFTYVSDKKNDNSSKQNEGDI